MLGPLEKIGEAFFRRQERRGTWKVRKKKKDKKRERSGDPEREPKKDPKTGKKTGIDIRV